METRGWKLCICFGLLSVALAEDASQSVPGAREDESTFTEFTLVSDSKSHLFSSCFDELNTVEATLQAIEVDEGKEYIRYLIDSDAEVTWEDVEGEDDIIACAFKAYEAGSLMFKHSNGVCSLAIEGFYNPNNASCDGEEVFIIYSPCLTSLGTEEPGHQYYSWLCETNCGSSGILTDQNDAEVNSELIPSEIVECCVFPCMEFVDFPALPCDAERICYFLGMTLPSAASGENHEDLSDFITSLNNDSVSKVLVNVQFKDSVWYHFPAEKEVAEDEWQDISGIPTTEGFVTFNNNGKLEPVTDSDLVSVICKGGMEMPRCDDPNWNP